MIIGNFNNKDRDIILSDFGEFNDDSNANALSSIEIVNITTLQSS